MDENNIQIVHKEIDLIQGCINRMAQNSFLLKGWAISIIVIIFALTDKKMNLLLFCLACFLPLLWFWCLDTFFLRKEKMYRKLYDWVLEKRKEGNYEFLYDLNPNRFANQVKSYFKVMFSTSLVFFYGIPVLLAIILIAFKGFFHLL